MPQIKIDRLQAIIREELASLKEGTDHDAASKMMSSATKLLKAVETFKETASEKSKSEFGGNLDSIQQTLQRIIASPMQYVDATKPGAVKKVSLKPTKSAGTL